jgi:hypothetical protein
MDSNGMPIKPVQTDVVRRQVITGAKKELKSVAGRDSKIGTREEKKLEPDVKKAVDRARSDLGRNPSVDEAAKVYTSYVAKVLGAVDGNNRGAGVLGEAEIKKISDPALRGRVVDVRTRLLAGTGARGDGPGNVNAAKLTAAIDNMDQEWGSENIMDGMVAIKASTVVGGSAKATAEAEMDALKSNGDVDKLVGARTSDGPRKASKADIQALAKAMNDDGFQYANPSEIGRIKQQIEGVLKALGGPTGLDVSVVKQNVEAHFISDTDRFPAQVHTFVNAKTGDAVSIMIRKGSL